MHPKDIVRLLLVALIFFMAGCESNVKGKIEGTKWTSKAATIKGKSVPAGFLQLEFGSDAKLIYRAGSETYTGTYTLGFGDSLTMHLDRALAGSKTHTETVLVYSDSLTMTDLDGTSMTFLKLN